MFYWHHMKWLRWMPRPYLPLTMAVWLLMRPIVYKIISILQDPYQLQLGSYCPANWNTTQNNLEERFHLLNVLVSQKFHDLQWFWKNSLLFLKNIRQKASWYAWKTHAQKIEGGRPHQHEGQGRTHRPYRFNPYAKEIIKTRPYEELRSLESQRRDKYFAK